MLLLPNDIPSWEKGKNRSFKTCFLDAVVAHVSCGSREGPAPCCADVGLRELRGCWAGFVLQSHHLVLLLFCHFRNSFPCETWYIFPLFSCLVYLLLFSVRNWAAPRLVSSWEFLCSEVNRHLVQTTRAAFGL